MISDEQVKKRIKRHHRRKSLEKMRYIANSYSKDYLLWVCLCALNVQSVIERDRQRQLTVTHMIILIAMKQYMVESGKDYFTKTTLRAFMRDNFKRIGSHRNAINYFYNLLKANYISIIHKEGVYGRKYCLTMKARAFFRDLNELISTKL